MRLSGARVVGLGLGLALAIAGCGSPPVVEGVDARVVGDSGVVRDSSPPEDGGPPPIACDTGCLVADVCFPDGVSNPANPCEICDHDASATAFSANDGAVCDDGAFCTSGDTCSAGVCAGSARSCDDGIACNGAGSCSEDASMCVAGTSTCGGGQICDALSGECVLECTGCLIDGTCYGDGQVNALDPCGVCMVATSRTDWSDNDGASCDDGLFCTTNDMCSAGVCSGADALACDDGVACDGVETCSEDTDACIAGATTCATDEICDVASDACIASCTGCVIGGVCYGEGQANPANQCQECAAATSATAWSDRTGTCDDGAYCTDGDSCSAGACVPGAARACADAVDCNGTETCDETSDRCLPGTSTCAAGESCDLTTDACEISCAGCAIAGVCYAAGTIDPSEQCQVCTPATSATAWSDRTGSCDDGAYCTDGDTCAAGACVAGAARACADAVTCNGTETCDEGTDSCLPGASTCAAGTSCDTTTDMCVASCGGSTVACDGMCVSTASDPLHCGGCGVTCTAAEACTAGACTPLMAWPSSCYEIRLFNPTAPSGAYRIDPDGVTGAGASFMAYCDMTSDGGGWTLLLKADGAQRTFEYDAALWTNTATLNPTSTDRTATEAKFASFSTVGLSALRIETLVGGMSQSLVVEANASSLGAAVSGPLVGTMEGRAAWLGLFPGGGTQPNCNREGLGNVSGAVAARARIGLVANQEGDCASPDSAAGVGLQVGPAHPCFPGGGPGFSVGTIGGGACTPSGPSVSAFAWVYARRLPRSCGEIHGWNNPLAFDGIYRIDPDGAGGVAPFDAYCDMTGGGWTLIMATNSLGPDFQTASTSVTPGSARYLPTGEARALAAFGTQVHIRTAGMASTRSMTSVANTLAITNLRSGLVLNSSSPLDQPSDDPSALWTGPMAVDSTHLWHSCGLPPHESLGAAYPTIYWACNNGTGLHIMGDGSAWDLTLMPRDEPLEVYVR